MNKIQKTIRLLVGYKFLVILIGSFIPYIGTHMFRQTDTLGVTIRYWLRWTKEETLQFPLLPAIINTGEAYGIAPMEFPILNLITVPGFIFGMDYGRFVAIFIHSLILVGLVWWNYKVWREKEILGVKVGITPLLFVVFGTAQIYFTRYMPDSAAFLLMSLACGYSWDKIDTKRSLPLATLALLMKPPVVFLFGLFFIRNIKFQLKNLALWAIPSVAICLAYYKGAIPYIIELSDVNNVFAHNLKNPIEGLSEFFADPYGIYKLFIKNFFTKYIVFLLFIDAIIRIKNKQSYPLAKLWVVFLIQVIASAALIGLPGFFHEYYYISTAFIACLLYKEFLEKGSRKLVILSLVILVGYTVERSIYTLRPVVRGHIWYQCREMEKYIPDDVIKLKTKNYSANPIIGVCMSRIVNSKDSNWAMYHRHHSGYEPPADYQLVHQTESFELYKKED